MGGGLGGGSSNAAYVLGTLAKLYKVEKDWKNLSIIAQKIGSDVPFFLKSGLAIGQSRGEMLKYFSNISNASNRDSLLSLFFTIVGAISTFSKTFM